MKRTILLSIITLLSVSGCKKYLEKEPRILASIQTADQLEALINNATAFTYQTNYTANYSSDDTEISMELYKNAVAVISREAINHYVLDVQDIVNTARDDFWNGEYKKIFTANLILDYADKVSGDAEKIKQAKADAYLIRAYAYWELVNYYCQPYSAGNLSALGLPLKKTTSYEESLKRASLKDTYDFILSDIMKARELVTADVSARLRWRASRPALDAFLSRYYLFLGDNDQAISYANLALGSTVARLVDYNTIGPGMPITFPNPPYTLTYSGLTIMNAAKFLYWDEFYFARLTYNSNQWNIPSTALVALYDQQNDLRYQQAVVPNSNRRFFILSPAAYRYTFFDDGKYIPEGPTVAEVLLNKAEALARKGEVSAALSAVNMLREKRFKTIINLSASTPAGALTEVLKERRRELAFAFRWLDIRRFSVNSDPSDDVSFNRTFFKVTNGVADLNSTADYSLPLNSKRYLVPVNGTEIANSQHQIEQNTYQ